MISPRPYKERQKRTVHPQRESFRTVICADINSAIEKKPQNFDEFLQAMQELGYEIKAGKQISMRGKNQKRFIRLSSLPEGYQMQDIISCIKENASRKRRKIPVVKNQVKPFDLLIDIQEKLQGKGEGYRRWATVYNLKQMSKTLLFLRDHNIRSIDQLNVLVEERTRRRDVLLTSIKASEKRLAEIAVLKKTHRKLL